jgi:hypothetical protein
LVSRIELKRLPARLHADRRSHALLADHVERQREYEGFGHGLNGERHGAVADLVDMAIDGDQADAEMRWVGALQFGDIIRYCTGIIRFEAIVTAGQETLERRFVSIAGISGGEITNGGASNLGVHIITLNGKK